MQELSLKIKDFIRSFSSSYLTLNIYGLKHPRTSVAVDKLHKELELILSGINEFNFGLSGEELFSGKDVFLDLTVPLRDFIHRLKEKNIEFLKFKRGINRKELEEFMEFFCGKEGMSNKDGQKLATEIKFDHLEIGRFDQQDKNVSPAGSDNFREKLITYNAIYRNQLGRAKTQIDKILSQKESNQDSLGELIKQISDASMENKNALFVLSSLKKHDDYTFVHCLNVATLTLFQAKNLGLPKDKIIELGIAGFLHDIGKIAIKRIILEKGAQLTQEEFKWIKSHVILGAKLLIRGGNFSRLVLVSGFQHHMGFNMQGYPKTRYFSKQNLASRIIAISDIYDALRSKRSYKESTPLEQVYEIMKRESGRLLDPKLLELFFKNLGVWPVGTLIKLDTQEIGLVQENNPGDIFRPKIEVCFDPQGERLTDSHIIDLTEKDEQGNFKRRILRHVSPYGEGQKFIAELFPEI